MEDTYTYTARNAEQPGKVVTFTLHGDWMSVSAGSPLDLVEQTVEAVQSEADETEETEVPESPGELWLKPLALSLVERGTRPFRIDDVDAVVMEGWLEVRGWFRVGGLRLAPLVLMQGPVDNPVAARAFVEEVTERKAELAVPPLLNLLDYWATWIVAGLSMWLAFTFWRQRGDSDSEA